MTVTDTRTFGPYEIVRRLGVGGMAETFLALRRGVHGVEQRVCLKRVLPAFASDPSFLRQFEREAHIASTLRYTGIVSVVEFGDVDGAKYLALELVDGVDLRDFLLSRPGQVLDPPTVGRVALDLAYALRYAHDPARGVVHRDLSPANVMLSRTGEVKLTDFGVARVMSSAAPTTSTGVRGKIAYMSPEHLRGEELDGRADLFALGVLLYECLCGQRPFHGAHDVEIMRRIAAGERAPVAERAPSDTPPLLLDAIEGLLTTDREARTASATALIEQLSPLPGLHQARRRLAAQVDELRGGVITREHVTPEREEASDTSLSPVPADALRDASERTQASGVAQAPAATLGGAASRSGDTTGTTVLSPARPGSASAVVREGSGAAQARASAKSWRSMAAGAFLAVLLAGGAAAWAVLPVVQPSFGQAAPAALAEVPAQPAFRAAQAGTDDPASPTRSHAADPAVDTPDARGGGLAAAGVGTGYGTAGDPGLRSMSSATQPVGALARVGPPGGASAGAADTAAPSGASGAQPVGTTGASAPGTRSAVPDPGTAGAGSGADAQAALARVAAAASAHSATSAAPAPTSAGGGAPSVAAASAGSDDSDEPAGGADEQDARPGTLRVTVIPWGDVWVDGRYMGRAPTEVTLRPGRHVVAAGTDRPSARRTVTVAPGQARRVELELSP